VALNEILMVKLEKGGITRVDAVGKRKKKEAIEQMNNRVKKYLTTQWR
jgi:hypothetical protein